MRELYAPIEPYRTGLLPVSDLHTLYFEEVGNPAGRPVVFLHGGPGGGMDADYRRYFDPTKWRIVLFDQRGCGRSTPHAELRDNTTWDLVADIERLRESLGIERWVVFGGSWGSTLALAYAETHPERCLGLVLRGIFLLRRKELLWFYQEGASWLFPDAWEEYLAPIPEAERGDLIVGLPPAPDERRPGTAAARGARLVGLGRLDEQAPRRPEDRSSASRATRFAEAFARIECHYFVNGAFLRSDTQLLDDASKLAHLPGVIVQGRYDVVCPAASAWELHKRWPGAALRLVGDAGHSISEPGIIDALVQATDDFAGRDLPSLSR